MARPIDEKIVKVSLDYASFKRGAMEVLESSKKIGMSLAENVNGISTSGAINSFHSLSDSILYNENSLSVLGVAAANVLSDIAGKVTGVAQQFATEWMVDPVRDGFGEYELKLDNIQTIMNGTGESLERVNDKLGELNTYSDQTIYSFKDMTDNIGKFTNAGVSLDDATLAIKGIANAAADAGGGAAQASMAMFNFSQALATGTVKAGDWISIEKSMLGTSDFKQTMLDKAVALGTLTKATDDSYVAMDGSTFAAKEFRTSLSSGWFTSDVLIAGLKDYSDVTTEIGQRATEAATEMRTFTAMMDSTKESLASGWAESFELIFGDLDSATELWTGLGEAIGNVIGTSADSRNAMLSDLRSWGAFDMLFESLGNVIQGVTQWVGVFTDAWAKVFPKATSDELWNVIKNFKDFTQTLDATRDQLDSFSRLFEGVLSVFKTVGTIVGNLAKAFLNLLPTGLTGGIFGVAEGMGGVLDVVNALMQPLVWLSEGFAKLTGIIGDIINRGLVILVDTFHEVMQSFTTVTDFLTGGWDSVRLVAEKVYEVFKKLKTSFSEFIDFVKGGKESIKTVVDAIKGWVEGLGESVKGFIDFIGGGKESLTIVVDKLKGGIDKLVTGLQNLLSGNVGDLLAAGGVFGGLVILGKKMLGIKDKIVDPVGTIKDTVKDFVIPDVIPAGVGKLTTAFEEMQVAISPTKILTIAGAIAVLVSSVVKLSDIPVAEISKSLIGIAKMLGIMSAALFVLSFIKMGDTSVFKIVTMMLGVAQAMTILADAITVLGTLNMDEMTVALIGLGGSLTIFIAGIKLLDIAMKSGPSIKSALMILAVAKAVEMLADVLVIFSALKLEEMLTGVYGLIAIMGGLVLVSKGFKQVKAASIIGASVSLKILGNVVSDLGDMDAKSLVKGLIGLSGAMLVLGAGSRLFKSATGNGKTFIMMATGVTILIKPIKEFSELSWDALKQGLFGFTIVMGLVTAAAFLLSSTTSSGTEFIKIGFGINGLIRPIKTLSKIPFNNLVGGLIGVGGALGLMVLTVKMMSGTTGGTSASTTLILFGLGLTTLVVPLTAIGLLPLNIIAKGLATIGIAVLGLALIGPTLGAAAGGMVIFSGGLLALSAALLVATVAFPAAMAAITVMSILLPPALLAIGAGILTLLKVIEWVVPAIVRSMGELTAKLLIAISDAAKEIIPAIGELSVTLFEELIKLVGNITVAIVEGLGTEVPKIITALGIAISSIITSILDTIGVLVPDVIVKLVEIVGILVVTVAEEIPKLAFHFVDGAIALINGMADGIRDNQEKVFDAVKNVMAAVLELIVTGIQSVVEVTLGWIPGVNEAAGKLGDKARAGIQEWFGVDAVSDIADTAVDGFTGTIISKESDAIGAGSVLAGGGMTGVGEFGPEPIAKTGVEAFNQAIKDGQSGAKTSGTAVSDSTISGLTSANFNQAGVDSATGYGNGLNSPSSNEGVWGAASNLANSALTALKRTLNINSPSKVFATMGGFTSQGFANGITDGISTVSTASTNLGEAAVSAVQNVYNRMSDLLESDFELSPVITPVLDMGNVSNPTIGAVVAPNSAGMEYYSPTGELQSVSIDDITVNISTRDTQQATETMAEFKSKVIGVLQEEIRKVKRA